VADVRILVCGMSRSGSTLLTKVLVKYFEIYHFKDMKIFPGKYFFSPPRSRRNFVNQQKNYIAKLHLRNETIRLGGSDRDFFNRFGLYFCTKRDIRDALSSELISLNFRESLIPVGSSSSILKKEVQRVARVLYLEHTLWQQKISERRLPMFDWKYESYKQNPIAQFENVFSYVKERCPFAHVPTQSQIQELLDEVEEPISLTSDLHRCTEGMSKLRSRASIIGTSSTGGKVGYYKKFLMREHLDLVNEKHRSWIEENGYDIE
jgi:hypothetical protein